MAERLEDWVTVQDAAKIKQVAESAVRSQVRLGGLIGKKMGRAWLVNRADLARWDPQRRGKKADLLPTNNGSTTPEWTVASIYAAQTAGSITKDEARRLTSELENTNPPAPQAWTIDSIAEARSSGAITIEEAQRLSAELPDEE